MRAEAMIVEIPVEYTEQFTNLKTVTEVVTNIDVRYLLPEEAQFIYYLGIYKWQRKHNADAAYDITKAYIVDELHQNNISAFDLLIDIEENSKNTFHKYTYRALTALERIHRSEINDLSKYTLMSFFLAGIASINGALLIPQSELQRRIIPINDSCPLNKYFDVLFHMLGYAPKVKHKEKLFPSVFSHIYYYWEQYWRKFTLSQEFYRHLNQCCIID